VLEGVGRTAYTRSQSAISVFTLPIRFTRSLSADTACAGCNEACLMLNYDLRANPNTCGAAYQHDRIFLAGEFHVGRKTGVARQQAESLNWHNNIQHGTD
jgi:hypothetical protein